MRKISFITLAMCLALTSISCASFKPITEIEGIVEIDLVIRKGTNSFGQEVSHQRLEPGQTYFVSVRYLQEKKGKQSWKNLYDYKNIALTIADTSFTINNFSFTTPSDPFYAFKNDSVPLTVQFPLPIDKIIKKDLSFVLVTTVPSFQGTQGEHGANGSTADKNGKAGSSGGDASTFDLEIARYDTKGTRLENEGTLVIIHSLQSFDVWLINPRNGKIVIQGSGGNGGNGGKGADMVLKKDEQQDFIQGGSGGDSGNGGRGAFARIIIPVNSTVESNYTVVVDGGKPGSPGKGGSGEKRKMSNDIVNFLASLVTDGPAGKSGSPGPTGRSVTEKKPMDEMFLNVTSPYFDRNKLLP